LSLANLSSPAKMFSKKAGAFPSEAPLRCTPLGRLERLDRYKHSSLFGVFLNNESKRFHNIGPTKLLKSIIVQGILTEVEGSVYS
jgi:hypothetical protein